MASAPTRQAVRRSNLRACLGAGAAPRFAPPVPRLNDGQLLALLRESGVDDLRAAVGAMVAYQWLRGRADATTTGRPMSAVVDFTTGQAVIGLGAIVGWERTGDEDRYRERHAKTAARWLTSLVDAGVIALDVVRDERGNPTRSEAELLLVAVPSINEAKAGARWLRQRSARVRARADRPTRTLLMLKALRAWRRGARVRGLDRGRARRAATKCPTPAEPQGATSTTPDASDLPHTSRHETGARASAPGRDDVPDPLAKFSDPEFLTEMARRVAEEEAANELHHRRERERAEIQHRSLLTETDPGRWVTGRRDALKAAYSFQAGAGDPHLAGWVPADAWETLAACGPRYEVARRRLELERRLDLPPAGADLLSLVGQTRSLYALILLWEIRVRRLERLAVVLSADYVTVEAAKIRARRQVTETPGLLRFTFRREEQELPGTRVDFGAQYAYDADGLPAVTVDDNGFRLVTRGPFGFTPSPEDRREVALVYAARDPRCDWMLYADHRLQAAREEIGLIHDPARWTALLRAGKAELEDAQERIALARQRRADPGRYHHGRTRPARWRQSTRTRHPLDPRG